MNNKEAMYCFSANLNSVCQYLNFSSNSTDCVPFLQEYKLKNDSELG